MCIKTTNVPTLSISGPYLCVKNNVKVGDMMAHIRDLHKQTFPESPVAMSNLIMFEGPVEAVRTFSRFGDNFLLFVKKDVVRRSWRLFVKIVGGEKNADKYKAVIDVEEVTTDRNHHHRFISF